MYYFTGDQHFGHKNIIKYCDRPFSDVHEMDAVIIERANSIVKDNDTVISVGDFTLSRNVGAVYMKYVSRLNGNWIFLKGSHDYWLSKTALQIWEKMIQDRYVVACHYAMRTWPRSHWGSIHVYGHSHGHLDGIGRSFDVGVDTHDFYPYSIDEVIERTIDERNFNELIE